MNPVSFDMTQTPPAIAGTENLKPADCKRLWGASRELEAQFNSYLLGDMGKRLPGTSDSFGGQIYAGFFKDTLAHELASGQHNGIAKMMYQNLTQTLMKTEEAKKSLSQTQSES
jgi:Rod binding domain-containing protein